MTAGINCRQLSLSSTLTCCIINTFRKLSLLCNHNQPSSAHMSAPIPLKPAVLLETEWAVISLFTAKQPAVQQGAEETQHRELRSLRGIVCVHMFVYSPLYLSREHRTVRQSNKLTCWRKFCVWTLNTTQRFGHVFRLRPFLYQFLRTSLCLVAKCLVKHWLHWPLQLISINKLTYPDLQMLSWS